MESLGSDSVRVRARSRTVCVNRDGQSCHAFTFVLHMHGLMVLTCRVGQLILLLLYAVLQCLGISSCNGNLLLQRLGACVGHWW